MPRPAGWTPTTPIDDINLNANTKDVIGDLDQLSKIFFPPPYNTDLVSAINNVPKMMSKTFYVDAVNGDDNNDGSQTAPFQTIKKAVDSVPVGGIGAINLSNNQTHIINNNIEVENKLIGFKATNSIGADYPDHLNTQQAPVLEFTNIGKFLLKKSAIVFGKYLYGIYIKDSYTTYIGTIRSEQFWNWGGGDIRNSSVVFAHSYVKASNYIRIQAHFVNLRKTGISHSGSDTLFTNCNIFLVSQAFRNNPDGTSATWQWSDIIEIVRDANGVPRNIISNIVL